MLRATFRVAKGGIGIGRAADVVSHSLYFLRVRATKTGPAPPTTSGDVLRTTVYVTKTHRSTG